MIQNMSFPLHEAALGEYRDWVELRQELDMLGCDGLEAIWGGEPVSQEPPAGLVRGYHLIFFQDWVDLWTENRPVLARKYGSLEQAAAVYGGLGREILLRQYWEDLERAVRLGAEYVVFHVSDVSLEECFTYRFSHTSDQVIDASLELINQLLRGRTWPFAILVENQWWPGFTFTDPRKTARLLDGIDYGNKGILLDTGHLMNCCPNLSSQKEGAAYITAMLDRHGSISGMIRGVHLHQSLSGAYVREHTGRVPDQWPETFAERFSMNYAHVLNIDRHQPWTDPAICPVLERVNPAYLTHELTSRTRAERCRDIAVQQALLRGRKSPEGEDW